MGNIEPIPDFSVNQRIENLISHLRIKPASFAASLEKSSTVINQILSRRNKPSYDLLESILLAYPQINANWLMRGEGPMMMTETKKAAPMPESNQWSEKLIEHLERENKRLWAIIEAAGLGKSDSVSYASFVALFFTIWTQNWVHSLS